MNKLDPILASGVQESRAVNEEDVSEKGYHTLTRVDLAEAVYRRVGLSRKESAALVQTFLSELADTLAQGETVKLSSFGSFVIRSKSERIGRNPKTGVEVPITQRRVMVFKPSNVLKARINGRLVPDEDE
jgi:integration host factor subunit alpha